LAVGAGIIAGPIFAHTGGFNIAGMPGPINHQFPTRGNVGANGCMDMDLMAISMLVCLIMAIIIIIDAMMGG